MAVLASHGEFHKNVQPDPCLIRLTTQPTMYQKIILAYDGSEASQQAMLNCKELSQWAGAQVHLLAVVPYDLVAMGPESAYLNEEQTQLEEERYRRILDEGIAQLKSNQVAAVGHLCKGDPVDQMVQYAQEIAADLIVLGHKHRDHWLERWWRGSISKALIEHSPCSVLVVILR